MIVDEGLNSILLLEVRLDRTLGCKMTDIQSYSQLLTDFKMIQLCCIPNFPHFCNTITVCLSKHIFLKS